jgi:hypothetical protein
LSDWACDEIQGYFFSEPVTAADCAVMLSAKKRLVRLLQLEPVASIEYLI